MEAVLLEQAVEVDQPTEQENSNGLPMWEYHRLEMYKYARGEREVEMLDSMYWGQAP